MRLYLDIDTGELRRTATGAAIGSLVFYLRDIVSIELVYVQAGEVVTGTVLTGPGVQKLGLKAPGDDTILALATSYVISGDAAVATFSLNTAELVAHFASEEAAGNVTPTGALSLLFEVEVTAADESLRHTYHQALCTVRREVNSSDDTQPPEADTALYVLRGALFDGNGRGISPFYLAFRGEITGRTGGGSSNLDGIVTTTLTVPFAVLLRLAGTGELWCLATGTDAEDGTFIVRPDDYDGSTNPRVWTRIL